MGPGRYGDINADGDFDDPGEEGANVADCGGVICVVKRVSILSTNGAEATVIDAAHVELPGSASYAVVFIRSNGVIFGEKNKGFTIANGPDGLQIAPSVGDVRVSANVARGNGGTGFGFDAGGDIWIQNNTAINNGFSGFLSRNFGSGVVFLSNNSAIANNKFGLVVPGFLIVGPGRQVIRNNTASSNTAAGFIADGSGYLFTNNTANSNGGDGIFIDDVGIEGEESGGHSFIKNNVIGNRGAGFHFGLPAGPGEPGSANNTVHMNNIFGNLGDNSNCGLLNESTNQVDATNNFWGAASGPGADPADNAGPGSGCDLSGNTIVEPFATKPFVIKP